MVQNNLKPYNIIIIEFLVDIILDEYLDTLWNDINIFNFLNNILMFVLFVTIFD